MKPTTLSNVLPTRSLLNDLFTADWPIIDWSKRNGLLDEWVPATNVIETEDSYVIEVSAPGMEKKDFQLNIANGILRIAGKHEEEREEKDKNYCRQEFKHESFERSFTLPDNVKEDAIQATYENGILQVKLGKTTQKKEARVIAVH